MAMKEKAGKASISKVLFACVVTAGAVMMTMGPENARAQNAGNVLRLDGNVKVRACLMPDGKPRPV